MHVKNGEQIALKMQMQDAFKPRNPEDCHIVLEGDQIEIKGSYVRVAES